MCGKELGEVILVFKGNPKFIWICSVFFEVFGNG